VSVRPRLIGLALVAAGLGCGGGGGHAADGGTADAAGVADAAAIDAGPEGDAQPGEACAEALPLALDVDVAGSTDGFGDDLDAACAGGAASAPDAVHVIELGDDKVDLLLEVEVDEEARAPFDAVVSVRAACGMGGPCADAGWGERLEANGQRGTRFVVIDGSAQFGGAPAGAYTLRATTRPIVDERAACDPAGLASRCADDLRCVAGTCVEDDDEVACAAAIDVTDDLADGAHALAGALRTFEADRGHGSCALREDGGAGEARVRFTLEAAADLVATTDLPGTDFDTVLWLEAGCDGEEVACADDVDREARNFKSRLEIDALPAGTYDLVIDASSRLPRRGEFALELTATPP
jgi:hypothetical protein